MAASVRLMGITLLHKLLGRPVSPNRLVYFVGAGASADQPTGLPLGNGLTEAYLDAFTPAPFLRKLMSAFAATAFFTGKWAPRFEMALNDLHRRLGPDVLDALHFFDQSSPHELHLWLAGQLAEGATILTTNFDTNIERAYESLFHSRPHVVIHPEEARRAVPENALVKLHGCLSGPTNLLGATLDNIKGGLPKAYVELLRRLLRAGRTFVFLGYSGLDYFDITPAFVKLTSSINSRAVWLLHSERRGFIRGERPTKKRESHLALLS